MATTGLAILLSLTPAKSKDNSLLEGMKKYLDNTNMPKREYLVNRLLVLKKPNLGVQENYVLDDNNKISCVYMIDKKTYKDKFNENIIFKYVSTYPIIYTFNGTNYVDLAMDGINGNEKRHSLDNKVGYDE